MDKIYIVRVSSGSWDDYMNHNAGFFTDKEAAEEYRELLDAQIKAAANRYTEEENEKFDEMYMETAEPSKEVAEWAKWKYGDRYNDEPWIEEIELNTKLIRP